MAWKFQKLDNLLGKVDAFYDEADLGVVIKASSEGVTLHIQKPVSERHLFEGIFEKLGEAWKMHQNLKPKIEVVHGF